MKINERAMLVKLSISQWYNNKVDRKVSDEVAANYGVSEHNDRYVKKLLPPEALKPVLQCITELRSFHNRNTMPWQDDSVRILPSANFFTYRQGIAERKAELQAAVDRFCAAYPTWVEHARQTKKGLFNELDYPTPQAIASQFGVSMTLLPFPSVSDFRLDITDINIMDEIKRNTEAAVADALKGANKDLIDRIYKRAYALYSALCEQDKVFRDNTVTSLGETAELVQSLNVSNDERVNLAVKATLEVTSVITPDRLRASTAFRNETAKRVAELLTALKE